MESWQLVTRQLGPLTRAVNSGSGNRALGQDQDQVTIIDTENLVFC